MLSKIINRLNKKNTKLNIRLLTLLGISCLSTKRLSYNSFESLDQAEFKIFSQNGEDGIIDFIMHRLGIKNPKFLEIGVEDYTEANTRFLHESQNSLGLIIDNSINIDELKLNLDLWKGKIDAVNLDVNSININSILREKNFHKNLDLFSIDIDGIDYWVIKKLPNKISKIFVAEYNPVFGPTLEVTVPNINNFNRTRYHYSNLCWGMSLKSLIKLMKKKGYVFIGTNFLKNNAFFVLEKYKKFFTKITKNIQLSKINYFTNYLFRESKNKNGELNYANPSEHLATIQNCKVIDLSKKKEKIIKIKDLI